MVIRWGNCFEGENSVLGSEGFKTGTMF